MQKINFSLTAHGITDSFERKSFILSVAEFEGTQDGEAIAKKLRAILLSWPVPPMKCHIFVRDGGENFKKVFY